MNTIESVTGATSPPHASGAIAEGLVETETREYVLILQNQPVVERFSRLPGESWDYQAFEGLEATVEIPSIRCELKLADLYDRVTFAEEPAASPPAPG